MQEWAVSFAEAQPSGRSDDLHRRGAAVLTRLYLADRITTRRC